MGAPAVAITSAAISSAGDGPPIAVAGLWPFWPFSFTGIVPICSGGETVNWDHWETLSVVQSRISSPPPHQPCQLDPAKLKRSRGIERAQHRRHLVNVTATSHLENPMRRKVMHSGVEISFKSRGFQLWCCSAMLLFKSRCHSHRSCGHTAHQSRRVLHVSRTSLSLPSCSSC